MISENLDLIEALKAGDLAVIRTDTLYGLVALAKSETAVKRVYSVKSKSRSFDKSLIVLIGDSSQAYNGPSVIDQYTDYTTPTSVIVDSPSAPRWLRHHDGTVAYRIPLSEDLRNLLKITGPLVAPSANPEGKNPARNIQMVKDYFGSKVTVYVNGGEVPADTPPSRIIRSYSYGTINRLR